MDSVERFVSVFFFVYESKFWSIFVSARLFVLFLAPSHDETLSLEPGTATTTRTAVRETNETPLKPLGHLLKPLEDCHKVHHPSYWGVKEGGRVMPPWCRQRPVFTLYFPGRKVRAQKSWPNLVNKSPDLNNCHVNTKTPARNFFSSICSFLRPRDWRVSLGIMGPIW